MNDWLPRLLLAMLLWPIFVQRSPAAAEPPPDRHGLTYTPGQGWSYEAPGGTGNWMRKTPEEQLQVAQAAFVKRDFNTALKAAQRVVNHPKWRFGDFAGPAQYLVGLCYEAKRQDEKAFKTYQKLLTEYPNIDKYNEVLQRQYQIANRFLAGQWYRLFGTIPFYRSMDKTIGLYEQVIKNGPYSDVAPLAQMKIGVAYESKRGFFINMPDYPNAAKAYEKAAERYSEQKIGAEALYQQAMAYTREARRAEYDQTVAGQAIGTLTDFITLHPEEPRVKEAQQTIDSLKTEQARGSFAIASFYEKNRRWQGALIYYNEVLLKDPGSAYANVARERIDQIKNRILSNESMAQQQPQR